MTVIFLFQQFLDCADFTFRVEGKKKGGQNAHPCHIAEFNQQLS